ncbi:geranylgeranylglycerol-phosphate geranylgeranyltransferase [Pseudofulvibacter geojedonensis]|uniref:Geranylgeranylglycerol-phosphate geranylgeranyltransferase n=1 Tax=Pseudofulvibacter geojedonensis TaxID=1123758 RepID=A0ABW3I5I7_9FLAO
MLSRKNKLVLKKLLSLFSVVRGYNILIIVIAQYLSSIYILAKDASLKEVVLDSKLFVLVFATSLVIAAGYIINNFYDSEKDLINRPRKSMLDRLVSQNTKLSVYFVLNIITVLLASYVSFKATLFFSSYIFMIWFYSHKLKKYPFVGNIIASSLAIAPFFIVFVYYQNFDTVVFFHGLYLVLIISMREITKDLENIKGDLALGYQTLPVTYGIKVTKNLLSGLLVFTCLTIGSLLLFFDIGQMNYYFYLCILLLCFYSVKLWKANRRKQYVLLHNLLKLIIVVGAFSIILIKPNLLLSKIKSLSVLFN